MGLIGSVAKLAREFVGHVLTDGVNILGTEANPIYVSASAATIGDGSVTGAAAALVADKPVLGGIPLLFRTTVASGANADVDITITNKIRVLDAWAVLKGAGTAGGLLTLKSTASAITEAINVSAGADKALFRAASIDDANQEIAAAGILRWSKASTGADFPGAECYVLAVRVA